MEKKGHLEKIRISRQESQRARMRKTTDKGRDIALTLPTGKRLRHGDTLVLTDDLMVIVEREPENVAIIELSENNLKEALLIGHAIGNLHRPIKVEGKRILFPIQSETEADDVFKKHLSSIVHDLKIKTAEMIFEPEEGLEDLHAH